MAGIDHDFLLLSSQEHSYNDYLKWLNHPKAILIPDEVLNYIGDSLKWVTCYNPSNRMKKLVGLNLYGPTVIKMDGARTLRGVFDGWANLFCLGPIELELTGDYQQVEGKTEGHYTAIAIDREKVVNSFRQLAQYCQLVVDSSDEFFVLHLGI